jgi:3-dehydroquinate synthase
MVKANNAYQIDVITGENTYPVYVGEGLLEHCSFVFEQLATRQVLMVSNETVAPLYMDKLLNAMPDVETDCLILKDGEQYKNFTSLQKIYDKLIDGRYHRDSYLIALGGGVVGDITGFAASTYQRGIAYIQIPTTLLAQVDASVGGKTAINHPLGKNMIGSFYQPEAVVIDVNTLRTLPEREFKAGLAEVIKYALLHGGTFFDTLYQQLEEGIDASDIEVLKPLIAKCCRIKADIVRQDEKETGLRALLNLGHTFAHALETLSAYKRWLHGEAVAIGLYCAVLLSVKLGYAKLSLAEKVAHMLSCAGLAYKIPVGIDVEQLCDKMMLDKKIKDKRLQFVLLEAPGACFLNSEVPERLLKETLIEAFEGD